MRNRIHLLRFLPVVAACILCAGNTPGETPNRGGSLVLNPASYQEVAPVLAPTTSLAFEFDTEGGLPPKMIVDATTQCLGVHDSLTDWNVWCFGEVRIPANVTITVGGDGSERLGAPIAILAHGDIVSSATWDLKGKGWKGGDLGQPGYGPGGGQYGSGAGHATFGESGHTGPVDSEIYNHGAPDGALHNLFNIASPLGSGGGGGNPNDLQYMLPGSAGGGALQLCALGSLTVAGTINVSATPGLVNYGSQKYGGAGSGGTLILACGRAFSDAQVKVLANGGSADSRQGSGGRVAIYANQGSHQGEYVAIMGDRVVSDPNVTYPSHQKGTLFDAGAGGFPFPLTTGTRSITLQGVVNNEKGHPVTGKFDARFRLYDAATSGSLLMEVLCELEVKQGAFSKELEISEALFRDHNTVYVEVWIDTNKNGLDPGDRFADRFKITSVPFAENANKLDGAK
jgi:hypothetical protein